MNSDPPFSQAADAARAHCEAWNTRDRDRWLLLFADDVVLEDPVGGQPKQGRAALEKTWERSQTADRTWTLRPQRIIGCGTEVAVDMANHGDLPTGETTIESIEIFKVDDDGLIASIRTFFGADPEVHDEYYLPSS